MSPSIASVGLLASSGCFLLQPQLFLLVSVLLLVVVRVWHAHFPIVSGPPSLNFVEENIERSECFLFSFLKQMGERDGAHTPNRWQLIQLRR